MEKNSYAWADAHSGGRPGFAAMALSYLAILSNWIPGDLCSARGFLLFSPAIRAGSYRLPAQHTGVYSTGRIAARRLAEPVQNCDRHDGMESADLPAVRQSYAAGYCQPGDLAVCAGSGDHCLGVGLFHRYSEKIENFFHNSAHGNCANSCRAGREWTLHNPDVS